MENRRTRPGGGARPRHLSLVRPGVARPRPTREQLRQRLALAATLLREIAEDLDPVDTTGT